MFHTNGDHDINDLGDVTAAAVTYTPRGKKNRNSSWYAALWPFNSNEIVAVGDTDPVASGPGEWGRAYLNNVGDFVLRPGSNQDGPALLHGEWGQANGPVSIRNTISSNGVPLPTDWTPLDITDRGAGDWPVIIGRSDGEGAHQGLIILTPSTN